MLTKVVSKKGKNWDELLGPVLFANRTAPHASSGETPFSLVYGRDARTPTSLDFYLPPPYNRDKLWLCPINAVQKTNILVFGVMFLGQNPLTFMITA